MKIFITGAKGLLGSSLCPYLRGCGYEVFEQTRNGIDGVVTDLTDYHSLKRTLNKNCPAIIINLAALANVDFCESNPRSAYKANTLIPENIARWINENSPDTHLIQISTDQVYDGEGPHDEDKVCLTNYYAFSKYAGELAAKQAKATIFRTNFFGVSLCPNRKTLSDWLADSFKTSSKIKIFEDVLFSPLSLTSLSKYIELSVRKRIPGVYNLGSRKGMSKANFAEELAEAMGIQSINANRCSIDEMGLKAYRPKDMSMGVNAFQKVFHTELPDTCQEIKIVGRMYTNESS